MDAVFTSLIDGFEPDLLGSASLYMMSGVMIPILESMDWASPCPVDSGGIGLFGFEMEGVP